MIMIVRRTYSIARKPHISVFWCDKSFLFCRCIRLKFQHNWCMIFVFILGDRLMVGQRPLKPLIGVRVPVSQLSYAKSGD